ncbi:MAG: fibronectin type III domain-containing protein [Actinobacteria bacterium]|nr:fibronectin type III domain-containing protein [Actinomycetota bacterium]
MVRHRNAIGSVVLAIALVASLAQAILRSDGFEESRVSLDNGSVWVTNGNQVGRLNLESRKIEVKVRDEDVDAGQSPGLVQAGSAIATYGSGTVRPISDAVARFDPSLEIPEGAVVGFGQTSTEGDDPRAVVADPASGKVWATAASVLAGASGDAEPATTVSPRKAADGSNAGLRLAVTVDGVGLLHRAGTDGIVEVDGDATSTRSLGRVVEFSAITAVGARPVLLDESTSELLVPGGSSIDLADLGSGLVLQQPGPARDRVLVSSDTGLWDVPLDGGAPELLVDQADGGAVQPVWVENAKSACAFGAWTTGGSWGRWCRGNDPQAKKEQFSTDDEKAKMRGTVDQLVFRVNHGRALLNNMANGANLLVDIPRPVVVDNWNDATDREQTDHDTQETTVVDDDEKCAESPPRPEPKDDDAGTRPGVPVVVHVLDNDAADPCDVLTVSLTEAQVAAVDGAAVAVVDDGSALQVTPDADRSTPVRVDFTVEGTSGAVRSKVVVSVSAGSANTAPETEPDRTVVTAGSIEGVQHNVLLNDVDPDGDALTLLSVVDETTGTAPRFQADGLVTYIPPGGSLATARLRYQVTDGRSPKPSEGVLEVTVRPTGENLAPTVRPDRAVAVVGRTSSINALANDTDPDGNRLILSKVEAKSGAADLRKVVDVDENGTVTFRNPPTAGRFVLETFVTDGTEEKHAGLIVTVLPKGEHAPVAVRDDVTARTEVPVLVDLLANDVDPDGDVLAVTAITVPPPPQPDGPVVAAELLDMRVARITVPAGVDGVVRLDYTVSDGSSGPVNGVVVVTPLLASAPDQRPIAVDDPPQTTDAGTTKVRAGGTASVAVLRNDIDPEGEQLRIVDPVVLDPSQGTAFVQGDQLRIRPKATASGSMAVRYTAVDPRGSTDDAVVHLQILGADAANLPPERPQVEVRVFAGETRRARVPLLSLDPDGDPVHLVGLDAGGELPELGTVTFVEDGFEYHAYEGAAGSDTFDFVVADDRGETATGTARVVVVEHPTGNAPPVAVSDRARVAAGTTRSIPVLLNDIDPDEDRIFLVDGEVEGLTQPQQGKVTLSEEGTEVVFEAPSQVGGDATSVSFTYGVSDGMEVSTGLVVVEVLPRPEPEPPVALDDAMTPQLAGTTVEVEVLDNDSDPDGSVDDLTVTVDAPGVSLIGGGKLRVQLGQASMQFVYEITDPDGETSRALVTIPVVAELPLVMRTEEVSIEAGEEETIDVQELVVLAEGEDPVDVTVEDVDRASLRGVELVGFDGSEITVRARPDWKQGGAGFNYVISSGSRRSVGSIRITVTGLKIPPKLDVPPIQLPEGATRTFDLARLVVDPDSTSHTFTGFAGAKPGEIDAELEGSVLRIAAAYKSKGATTELTVLVDDGVSDPAKATISVEVTAIRALPPVAVTDSVTTDEDEPKVIDVLANDRDPIDEGLEIESRALEAGIGGRLEIVGDALRFTPTPGSFGIARATYTIRDVNDRTATGIVEIEVFGRPGRPVQPGGTAGNGQVDLHWQPPTRGVSADGYVVKNVDTGHIYDPVSTTSMTVPGLTNGRSYRFQVAALNRVVTSQSQVRVDEWSSTSVPLTPDAAPPAVPNFRVEFDPERNAEGAGGVLHLTWSAPPRFEGSPIEEYVVTSSRPVGDNPLTFDAHTFGTTLTGLTNGLPYGFTIRARNASGTNAGAADRGMGPPGEIVTETPAGIPDAVPSVTAVRANDPEAGSGRAATVTWQAAPSNGDAVRYEVVSVPAGFHALSVDGLTTPATGLQPSETYRFTVTPSNKAGAGRSTTSTQGTIVSPRPTVTSSTMLPGNNRVTFSNNGDLGGQGAAEWQARLTTDRGQTDWTVLNGNAVTASNDTRYTNVQIRLCNRPMLDQRVDEGEACSADRQVFNPNNRDSPWVIPYGAPTRGTASVSGRTVTWGWTNPVGAPGAESAVETYDPGVSRTVPRDVTVSGQGGPPSPALRITATLEDSTSIRAWSEGNAAGEPISYPTTGYCDSRCTYGNADVRGFEPNTTFYLVPLSDMDDQANRSPTLLCVSHRIASFRTDANGNANIRHTWWVGQLRNGERPNGSAYVSLTNGCGARHGRQAPTYVHD